LAIILIRGQVIEARGAPSVGCGLEPPLAPGPPGTSPVGSPRRTGRRVPSPLRGLTGGSQCRPARKRIRPRSDRQFRRHRPYPIPPLIGQGGLGGLRIKDRVLGVSPYPCAIVSITQKKILPRTTNKSTLLAPVSIRLNKSRPGSRLIGRSPGVIFHLCARGLVKKRGGISRDNPFLQECCTGPIPPFLRSRLGPL